MNQYYKDIQVWGGTLVATKEQIKNVTEEEIISGSFLINIHNDLTSIEPAITKKRAIEIGVYSVEGSTSVDRKSINIQLFAKILNQGNVAQLVYILDFYKDEPVPSRPFFVIDSQSGKILEQWEGLTTLEGYRTASGPGGNQKTGKYYFGLDFGPLIVDNECNMKNKNVETYDLRNTKDEEVLYGFKCPSSPARFINGAYAPINDAHYFGNTVYEMYRQWFDLKVLPSPLKIRVHYDRNYDQAFWNGRTITVGDGNDELYPLVAQDIIAHEISHGFTDNNSKLSYKKQAGAINESFSDIAGEVAKYYLYRNKPSNQRNDWMVGNGITKKPYGVAIRYFDDPKRDGVSIDNVEHYNDNLDVHHASGVYNKAFYLLANARNWDVRKAFEPFLLANQIYWSPNSNFSSAACGVIQATADIGYNTKDVVWAFREVGIHVDCTPTQNSRPTQSPETAIRLENSVPYTNLTGGDNDEKLFSIDIKIPNASILSVWNYGGNIMERPPIMYVAYNRIPSSIDFDCVSTNDLRACYVVAPQKGKYYIKLNSEYRYNDVAMWALYN